MNFKNKEMGSLRMFLLLLRKSWQVRRRHWIVSLIEIVIPVSYLCFLWLPFDGIMSDSFDVQNETHYQSRSLEQLIDQIAIGSHHRPMIITYTPSNPFIDKLMNKVDDCLESIPGFRGFDSKLELVTHASTFYPGKVVPIIFDESTDESTKHLHYVILKPRLGQFATLWYRNQTDYYTNELYVQSQICLDRSFIEVKSNKIKTEIPQVNIQQYPSPSYTRPKATKKFLIHANTFKIVLCVFIVPQIIEASKVTGEKTAGTNILMSMNGIPKALNLLSWVVSGLIFPSLICVVSVGLLYFTNTLYSGNPIILFIFIILHLANGLTFTIHLSAHIPKTFRLAFILIVLNYLLYWRHSSFFGLFNLRSIPFVGMIFPTVLFDQAMMQINTFEQMGLGIQWSNIFDSAIPLVEFQNTLGMLFILSAIGTLLHFWLAIYVNTIKPGKFGIKRHPLFFLMRKNKDREGRNVNSLSLHEEDGKYFESTSTSVQTAWIRIRNLNMVYDACFFYKEKVHALRDISIDFYKGQITSILGHNGAGKSTLMSILSGLMKPTDGLILVGSKSLEDETFEVLKDVGFYAQSDICFPTLTVQEQLEFFAMVKKGGESMLTIKSNISSLIRKLKLFDVKDFLPTKLTEDQKRKLCLGIAFAADPSTLILDEPTSRLDYENKRIVWDILLEMRGRKTILISTNDMEEADILGDRIAIMHEGRFKSYGTSLYLKKMIAGQSKIGVTLSVERWCDPERIRHQIHNEAQIIEKQDKRMIVDAPISPTLSRSIENLEKNKKELGVTGIELSHVGLERVFIKVAEDSYRPQERDEVIIRTKVKRQGIGNQLQSFQALLAKNLQYALRNVATLGTQVFALFLGLILMSNKCRLHFYLWEGILNDTTQMIDMQLNIYDNPYTMYTSSDENTGNQYRLLSQSFGARSVQVSRTNLDNALLQSAKTDIIRYSNNLVAAAEFNKSVNGSLTANAFYSNNIVFSLPISINLVSNLIVQSVLGDDFSIATSCLGYLDGSILEFEKGLTRFSSLDSGVICVVPIYYAIATFAARPSIESANGFKHLQRMTGVSGFTYWAAMFLSDLAQYLFLVVPLVIGSACIDHTFDLSFYGVTEIGMMILLLTLLAVNVLPIIYIFSLFKTKNNFVQKCFIFIPIGLVVLEFATNYQFAKYHLNDDDEYSVIRVVYLALPYISFLRAQMKFLYTGMVNAICRSLPDFWFQTHCRYSVGFCCQKHCRDRSCLELIPYFSENHIDSLKVCVIWLSIMPIIYFAILALFETKIIQKIVAKFPTQRVRKPCSNEQLQLEKSIIHNKIQTLREKRTGRNIGNEVEDPPSEEVFLAYELEKQYGKVRAVEDVSLRVNNGECFGLCGANRSGKSTILRILAGNEIPDHGIMFFDGMHFKNNQREIGYCSQQDATLKCLNSYDHLRLFARLRGVPEDQVEEEVRAWIGRLNLTAYASQPSGTLSSGNKQRLNLAMALFGSPKFVLMDEPTTFMDPGARRSFWRTVMSCKSAGQTFLVASHNMDECEILCERTAIMLDGKLLCLGTPDEMKNRFGAGYDVQIRISPRHNKSQVNRIKKDMRLLLQCVLTDENIGYLMYYVIGAGTTWSKIYGVMNKIKSKYECVDDFLVIVRLTDQSV